VTPGASSTMQSSLEVVVCIRVYLFEGGSTLEYSAIHAPFP
jgi:hypothetical protein